MTTQTTQTKKKGGMETFEGVLGSRKQFRLALNEMIPMPGLNIRDFTLPENQAHVEWLAQNMKDNGQEKPLKGKLGPHPDDASREIFLITDGESRYRALKLLEKRAAETGEAFAFADGVWVDPTSRGVDDADLVASLFRANSGKGLTPLEKSVGIARLAKIGLSVADIARRIGESDSQVQKLLPLAEAPTALKAMISSGDIVASLALEAIKECSQDPVSFIEEMKQTLASAEPPAPQPQAAPTNGAGTNDDGASDGEASGPVVVNKGKTTSKPKAKRPMTRRDLTRAKSIKEAKTATPDDDSVKRFSKNDLMVFINTLSKIARESKEQNIRNLAIVAMRQTRVLSETKVQVSKAA